MQALPPIHWSGSPGHHVVNFSGFRFINTFTQSLISRSIAATVKTRYRIDGWFYRQPESTSRWFANARDVAGSGPMLVVGNGPSINDTPLEQFAHLPAIGMNKIDLLFSRTRWRPTVIVCVNNLVVKQHRDRFAASEIPILLAWKTRWFMGRTASSNVHYFRNQPTLEFSRNAADGIAGLGATVTYPALQLAYYMGANPVILVGIDHSFKNTDEKSGIARRSGPDLDHFDADYFRHGELWGLPDLEGSERAYRLARQAFEGDGRQILDATVGGKLTVFPKITIEDAKRLAHA